MHQVHFIPLLLALASLGVALPIFDKRSPSELHLPTRSPAVEDKRTPDEDTYAPCVNEVDDIDQLKRSALCVYPPRTSQEVEDVKRFKRHNDIYTPTYNQGYAEPQYNRVGDKRTPDEDTYTPCANEVDDEDQLKRSTSCVYPPRQMEQVDDINKFKRDKDIYTPTYNQGYREPNYNRVLDWKKIKRAEGATQEYPNPYEDEVKDAEKFDRAVYPANYLQVYHGGEKDDVED